MDGTLIDSRADLAAAVNHTRRDVGLPEISMEEILSYVGQGAKHLLTKSILEHREADGKSLIASDNTFSDLSATFKKRYAEHMLESVTLYPGVTETLAEMSATGWKLGINTSKPNFATHAILEHLNIAGFFGNAVIAGGDCVEMKPSALPLVKCAEIMGHTLTADDWMIGDNWTDMDSGKNAGIKSAFCTFGFGTLKNSTYTVKINCFSELAKVI